MKVNNFLVKLITINLHSEIVLFVFGYKPENQEKVIEYSLVVNIVQKSILFEPSLKQQEDSTTTTTISTTTTSAVSKLVEKLDHLSLSMMISCSQRYFNLSIWDFAEKLDIPLFKASTIHHSSSASLDIARYTRSFTP